MLGDKVEIDALEYNNLLFRKKQYEQICDLVDKMENGEIDSENFYDDLLNIL